MASALEVVREAYENYCCGRIDPVLDACAENVQWRSVGSPASIPWAGDFNGRDAVRGWFQQIAGKIGIEKYEVKRYIAQDDWVVVLSDVTARFFDADQSSRFDKCDVLRVKDGQIVEFLEFYDTATAQDLLRGERVAPVAGHPPIAAAAG